MRSELLEIALAILPAAVVIQGFLEYLKIILSSALKGMDKDNRKLLLWGVSGVAGVIYAYVVHVNVFGELLPELSETAKYIFSGILVGFASNNVHKWSQLIDTLREINAGGRLPSPPET